MHFYELHVLCFAGLVALHSTAQMPLRQWKDQNSVSALIFTGLTSVWIIALLSAALLLICISIRKIRAWPSVFKASWSLWVRETHQSRAALKAPSDACDHQGLGCAGHASTWRKLLASASSFARWLELGGWHLTSVIAQKSPSGLLLCSVSRAMSTVQLSD